MDTIDWDGIAEEADSDSPRAIIAEALEQASEITSIVIIKLYEDGLVSYSASTKSSLETAGLIAYALSLFNVTPYVPPSE